MYISNKENKFTICMQHTSYCHGHVFLSWIYFLIIASLVGFGAEYNIVGDSSFSSCRVVYSGGSVLLYCLFHGSL